MAEQQIENWKIPLIFQCFEFSFYIALNPYIFVNYRNTFLPLLW